jgi:hypothetical protein
LQQGAGQVDRRKQVGAVDGQCPGGRYWGGLVVGQGRRIGEEIGEGAGAVGEQGAVCGAVQVNVDEVCGGLG